MNYLPAFAVALLLGGCSLQQSNPAVTEYRLKPPVTEKASMNSSCKETTLRIGMVQSSSLLQRQNIYYADDSHRQYIYTRSRWAEAPDKQLRHLFEDAIARNGVFKSVITYMSEAQNDQLLEFKVTDFMQYFEGDGSYVHFAMELTLIDQESAKVLSTQHIDLKMKTESADAQGAVKAFNRLMEETLTKTTEWLHGECT